MEQKNDGCSPAQGKPKKIYILNPDQARKARILLHNHPVQIGIDPGYDTGFAEWSRLDKVLRQVKTVRIHEAIKELDYMVSHYGAENILVRVEDARQRQYLPKEKSSSEYRGKLMGAGSVKRDCKIWEDYLTSLGVDFEMVAPRPKKTKWTDAYFKSVTKYTKPTSEHARDAAVLVFGL
jgi:hypothetical protein